MSAKKSAKKSSDKALEEKASKSRHSSSAERTELTKGKRIAFAKKREETLSIIEENEEENDLLKRKSG